MDESEELACAYLKWRGFQSIEFEPEGNSKVPDFLIDGRIAVEVRRLNQNYVPKQPGMKIEGLEEQRKPIWNNVSKLLPSLGPPVERVSWYVDFQFERPAPAKRSLEPAIRQQLGAFLNNEGTSPATSACSRITKMAIGEQTIAMLIVDIRSWHLNVAPLRKNWQPMWAGNLALHRVTGIVRISTTLARQITAIFDGVFGKRPRFVEFSALPVCHATISGAQWEIGQQYGTANRL